MEVTLEKNASLAGGLSRSSILSFSHLKQNSRGMTFCIESSFFRRYRKEIPYTEHELENTNGF